MTDLMYKKQIRKNLKNEGSTILEMCLLTPILIGILFFSISILFVVMNKGIAMAELTEAMCYKESYVLKYGDEYAKKIEENIKENFEETSRFSEDVQVSFENSNAEISYKTKCLGGVSQSVLGAKYTQSVKQEFEDTSKYLRRWQIYANEFKKRK